MPELNFKITGDDSSLKKTLANIAKSSSEVNEKISKEISKGVDSEAKSRQKAVQVTQDQKKSSNEVVAAINEEVKAHDRATEAIKRKKGAFDEITGLQKKPVQMSSSLDEVNSSNASKLGTIPSGTVVGTAEEYNKAASQANAFGAAAVQANNSATEATNKTTQAVKNAIVAQNSLRIQLDSYKSIKGSSTDPAIIAEYNRKIAETQAEIQKLNNVGKRGYDELGNRIKATIGQQEVLTTRLKYFQDQLIYAKAPQSFVALNQKIQETENQLNRLANAGKKGFDDLGNKIKEVDTSASKFVNTLKAIGAAILAAFSVQVILGFLKESRELAARGEGIREAFSKLGDTKTLDLLRTATRGATSDIELMSAALRAKNFQIAPELLAKGLELAGKVSRQTGQDVTYLADSFVNGLGRKSLLILDNLQISQVQLRAEIKKTGDFQTAVGNVIEEKLRSMGEVSMTTADKMAQFATKIANIKELVGQKINLVLNYDALREANKEFYATGISIQNLQRNITPLLAKYDELTAKAEKNGGVTKLSKIEQALLKDTIKQVSDEIPGAITQFDKYGNAMAISTSRAREFIEQQVLVLQALNEDRIKKTVDRLADLKEELRGLKAPMDEISKTGTFTITTRVGSENGTRTVQRKATEDEKKEIIKRYQDLRKTEAQQEALRAADSGELLKKRQGEIEKFQKITKTDDGKAEEKERKEAEKAQRARERQDAADAAALSAQQALQQRIQVLKDKFERSGLTKEQEARRAIIDEFKQLAFDIEQQGKKYDAYAKKYGEARAVAVLGPKQTTDQIEPIRAAAIDDLNYRQETARLELELEKQRSLYEDFENYKKIFGEQKAEERFKNELDTNKSYLKKLQDNYSKLILKSVVGAVTGIQLLTGGEQERLAGGTKSFITPEQTAQKEKYITLLRDLRSFEDQKKALTQQYNADFLLLQGAGKEGERALLTKAYQDQTDLLIDSNFAKTEAAKRLNQDILILTRTQITDQIKLLEESFSGGSMPAAVENLISGLKSRLKIGAGQSNLDALKQEQDDLILAIDSEADKTTPKVAALNKRLLEVLATKKALDKNVDGKANTGLGAFIDGLTDNKALLGVSKGLSLASDAAFTLSEGLGGVDTKAGYTLDTIGKLAGAAGDLVGAITSGDPVKIIGSAINAVGTLFSIGKKVKEMNAAARKEVEDYYTNAIAGEREYQDLLKERELQTVRNNKVALQGIRDELALRKAQNDAYSKEANEIMDKLQSQSFVSGETYKHGTWFRKAEVQKTYGSLQGKSFADLSSLLAQGKLEGDAKALVERLKELEQKGYDAEQAIRDLAKETSELFTGTTSDNLTNTLAEMFASGKTSAQDLADFFKQSMDDAALSIFKNKVLADSMEQFYEAFDKASQSDDQLTASEIATLNGLFTSLTGDALKKWEDFKAITGSDLKGATGASDSALKKNITQITSDQANALEGVTRGTYDQIKILGLTAKDLVNIGTAQLNSLIMIQQYTGDTATNTSVLSDMAKDMKLMVANTNSTGGSLRGAGLQL